MNLYRTGTLILTFGILLFFGAPLGHCATVRVADFGDGSASYANALAAYNAAVAGDTVVFPGNGSATWSSTLEIQKHLTLDGSGTTLAAGPDLPNEGFFHVTQFSSDELLRITDFEFDLVDYTNYRAAIVIKANIALNTLRIDNNTFHYGFEQIQVSGSKGVIDNNTFLNSLKAISFSAGSMAQANASWDSMAAGTDEALFIEDNRFIDNGGYPLGYTQEKIGTYNGGKLVVRHNEFDFDAIPITGNTLPIMTHGSAAGGVANGYWQIGTGARRGQSVVEIYNNEMHGKRIDFLVILRGSANLVHNNNIVVGPDGYKPRIFLREEEYADTSNWRPLRTQWPAEDQVHNTFLWNNTIDGVAMTGSDVATGDADWAIIENRDYFMHEPQTTGGRAVFTGLNGASESYPTDGTVYPTLGTMSFEPTGPNAYYGYHPYTYPHPLRNSGGNTNTVQAPQNLKIVE